MTKLFEALKSEAQEELVRDHVIELLTVIVRAVPDPDRPDDRLAMKIAAEVYDEFAPGIPWIDTGMARIREICASASEDISVLMQDALLVALNRRRRELDGLREGKIGGHPVAYLSDPKIAEFVRPVLRDATAEISVWSLAWTVAMDDDGKLMVDEEESISAEDVDEKIREEVYLWMSFVNDLIGRVVMGLIEE